MGYYPNVTHWLTMQIRRRPTNTPIAIEMLTFQMASGVDRPANILEEIVWYKEVEVDQQREKLPLEKLKKQLEGLPPTLDFAQALRTEPFALIAEVKKASPSKGLLRADFDPVAIAKAYVQGGAQCLSVLTDQKFFQGSLENLQKIRAEVKIPLLCKEFILSAYQLYQARIYGADAALLIVALHTDQDLKYFYQIARSLGLAVIVEVHTLEELDRALCIPNVAIIGINNRNLVDFTVDLGTTERLISARQAELSEIILVAESGIQTHQDLIRLKARGCGAFLVGEQLVRAVDPARATQELLGGYV